MNDPTSPLPLADLNHVQQHAADLWPRLRGETVLLTGGTGTIGRWLLESFAHINRSLDLQARVLVLTRSPEHFAAHVPHLASDPCVRFVRGDVRALDPADVSDAQADCPAGRVAFVVHAASDTSPSHVGGAAFRTLDTLYSGTRRVLEWAVTQPAARVLLLSSSAVYLPGPALAQPVSEEHPEASSCASAANAAGEGHRVMELLGAIFREEHGLDCKTARCFGWMGPGMGLKSRDGVCSFIQDVLGGGPVLLPEDGASLGSYLYLADLAVWLWTMLLRDSVSSVFNVGSDEALPLGEIAERIAALSPERPPVIRTGAPGLRPTASSAIPDVSRARRELGLDVWIPFATAVRKTFQYYGAWFENQPPQAVAA
ncbi:MAG: NAD(P)-dependent oxidoreductase [Verrucomicrobia bacterium]|nr:NAD(P)-dependent oxidoreductase [Verrucomicrobiota bacterium]